MRRRLHHLATVPLFWPLELLSELDFFPSRRGLRVYLAVVQALSFVLAALLWIDTDHGVSGS